jgi:hypothetical protein
MAGEGRIELAVHRFGDDYSTIELFSHTFNIPLVALEGFEPTLLSF